MIDGKSKIQVILTAIDTGLTAALKRGNSELRVFGAHAKNAIAPLRSVASAALSLKTAILGLAGGAGLGAIGTAAVSSASAADKAFFNMRTSLQAANREFQVGSTEKWASTVRSLTDELKIYSESAVTQAVSKTVDMTKRLGLSEEQMIKVIRAAANLSAGKFDLSDGVERVTAALRGEAEASEALGLTLSETYVKGWYEAKGATQGAWKDLDDLQKAQVRYNVLLEQSNPLLGKAGQSMTTYGGVTTMLKSKFGELLTSLGQVVTNNKFFVSAIAISGGMLQGLAGEVSKNSGAWRQWAKESALSVLQFVADTSDGMNDVYKSLSTLGGVLKITAAGTFTLGKGFQYLFEQANKMAGNTDKAEYWAQAQKDSAELIDKAMSGAAESFNNAERGSQTLDKITGRITQLKAELDKIKAEPVNPTAGLENQTQRLEQDLVKVGNTWTNVQRAVSQSTSTSANQASADWDNVFKAMEAGGKKAAGEVAKAFDGASTINGVQSYASQAEAAAQGIIAAAASVEDSWKTTYDEAARADSKFIEQAKRNIAFLEAEAAKGNLSEAALAQLAELKQQLAELIKKAANEQKKEIEAVAEETGTIGDGYKASFDVAVNDSYAATRKILADISRIKKAAASIKYATPEKSSGTDGYAQGGNPFYGGLRGYGGGDRRLIWVEDGEHVVRKEATRSLGHGFFQRFNNLSFLRNLPRFALGGPIGAPAFAAASAGPAPAPPINLTLNYSGSGSRTDAKSMADMVMHELERRYRRSSR